MVENNYISEKELFTWACDNGMIDVTTIATAIEMKKREEYLQNHDAKIWQSNKGRWYTYLITEDGRRQITASSLKDLEDKIVNHYKEIENDPTLDMVFYEWLADRLKFNEISKGTYDRYVNDYIRFFKDSEIKSVKIKRINEDDLDEFIRESITEKDLSQKAYSNLRTIVRGMFKYAKRRKYTDINISAFFQDIDLAKRMFKRVKHDPESQVFSETEIPRLIEWLDTHPRVSNYGVILALQTGLRTAELAALKYSDIQDNVLHVQRQEIKYKGETKGEVIHEIVDYCKTDMGDRYIYLTDSAIATIKKIKLMNPFGEYLMTENGKRVKTNTFNDRLRLACKSLGIPVRTMHKLRKTYGTTLIDNGVDESLIMQQMGHKDISTTRKYYYFANKDNESNMKQIKNAINY